MLNQEIRNYVYGYIESLEPQELQTAEETALLLYRVASDNLCDDEKETPILCGVIYHYTYNKKAFIALCSRYIKHRAG